MITKNIIENFELSDGMEVYVQASARGGIALSFDGAAHAICIHMTSKEAKELAKKLNKVVGEA